MKRDPPIVHVVDDDVSFRTAVSRLLRAVGHTVETFSSAAAFLERHGDAVHLTPPGTCHCPQSAPGLWLPDEWHDGFFYALLEKR